MKRGLMLAGLVMLACPPAASAAAPDLALPAAPARATPALERLRATLGRTAVVRPGAVARLDGRLTARSARDPADVALRWARANLGGFGELRLARRYRSLDGVTHLVWEQRVDGVPLVGADLQANVDAQGRLLNVFGSPQGGVPLTASAPDVGARDAFARVLRSAGSAAPVPAVVAQRGALRRTDFAGTGEAGLVAYAVDGRARLAWRVLAPASHAEDYDAVVDAETGRVVRRANLVRSATARVHDGIPDGTDRDASIDAWLTPGAQILSGPFAHAFRDVFDDVGTFATSTGALIDTFTPSAGSDVGPSDGENWTYRLSPMTGDSLCPPSGCTWQHAVGSSWQTNDEQATTQLFYFVNVFHDHLAAPPIGFDAASGAFEGGDPVLAQSDDGANTSQPPSPAGLPDDDHIDNANFDTRPDGTPGRMQMYLFSSPFNSVNGADDPTIVWHEYTHGLSNRLIADAQGFGALDYSQAGAMGEGWSDWYALDFLDQPAHPLPTPVRVGAYEDRGQDFIRSEPIDCPVGPATAVCGAGGYTYGDFGKIALTQRGIPIPEVHADGEIWAQTLWELRQALGSARAEKLITSGMRLGPEEPTFLDERNGILQADALDGSPDAGTIWRVFAGRGMGYLASTTGGQDVAPVESFALPPAGAAPPVPPSPSPIPTPIQTPIAALRPDVSGTRARLKASRSGVVSVRVRCPAVSAGALPARCLGALSLRGRLPGSRRTVTLASRTFSIGPGGAAVRLQLVRAARTALRRHTLKVTLTARVGTRTDRKTLRLRR